MSHINTFSHAGMEPPLPGVLPMFSGGRGGGGGKVSCSRTQHGVCRL